MDFVDIINAYDLISIAEGYGVRLKGSAGKWGLCPFPHHVHANNTPSFSIYDGKDRQRFKCHGNCGLSGDVVDFLGYMEIPNYDPYNKQDRSLALAHLRGGKIDPKPAQKIAPVVRPFLPQFLWEEFIPISDSGRQYLRDRGLTDTMIDEFKFGSASSIPKEDIHPVKCNPERLISIPTFELGTLMGIKMRVMGNTQYRYFSVSGSRASFWGYDDIYMTTEPVIIAKGEICAAVMRRDGFLSGAPTGGEGAKASFESLKNALVLTKAIYVSDNDPGGRKYGPTRAALLNAELKYPPDPFKDWDEWYLADREDTVRQTNKWLEAL
jgi:hypothetical protein